MRKVLFPLAFIGCTTAIASLAACEVRVGSDPKNPNNAQNTASPQNTAAPSTPATTAAPQPTGPHRSFGKQKFPTPTPSGTTTGAPTTTSSPTGTTTGTPPAPGTPAVVSGNTPFGSNAPDPAGWKGTISWTNAGLTKLPDMTKQTAAGYLFIKTLDIPVRPFTEGFPGVDANRKENFAIRYEAPLLVNNEADYEFKLAADDGAVLSIDGMVIVDNGDKHDFKDKTGPVHLVKGTHAITVDYFQTTGNIGLQLMCKRLDQANAQHAICANTL